MMGVNTTVLTVRQIPGGHTALIISNDVRHVFEMANYVTISAAIGLFGICTNVVNIMVFLKMGLKDVINISLFALTVSDLCGLVILEWFNICINPFFRKSDLPFVASEILYVMAGWPHSCFMKITCLITAFISLERCLCIALPLKVKSILTPVRARTVVAIICLAVFVSAIPAYLTVRFHWRFDEERNRTVFGIYIDKDKKYIADIAFIVNTIMQITAFGSVIVTTVILVKKLKEKAKWRKATASYGKGNDMSSISSKDKELVRMVILLSVILILCCTPGSTCFVISLIEKDFSVTGLYKNAYSIAWSFAYITDAINPSLSIFLYLAMSSHYRKAFYALFKRCPGAGGNNYDGSTTCSGNSYMNTSDTKCYKKHSVSGSDTSRDSKNT